MAGFMDRGQAELLHRWMILGAVCSRSPGGVSPVSRSIALLETGSGPPIPSDPRRLLVCGFDPVGQAWCFGDTTGHLVGLFFALTAFLGGP